MGRVPVTQPLAVDRHGAQLAGIENLFEAADSGSLAGRSRRLQRPLRWCPPNNGLDPAIEGRYPFRKSRKNFEETSDERASTDPHSQLAVHAGNAPGAFCKGS